MIEVDLERHTVNLLVDDEEFATRQSQCEKLITTDQTPWQEMYRSSVNQLEFRRRVRDPVFTKQRS